MLVLIAGATGNLGQKLVESIILRGHKVRALGRNPEKIQPSLYEKLHDFIQTSSYDDVAALDRACADVDAVICAYSGIPILQLDGQLLLLRAAEKAGVKTFVAASWNYDWRDMTLGMHESYDPYISFRNQVQLTSDLKPIYIFTGVLAEVLFSLPGHGDFSPANNGVWDSKKRVMEVWGSGDEIWHWTTEHDAAEFTAAIVERPDASEGGFWTVCSGSGTLKEMAATYSQVKSCQVDVQMKGSLDELQTRALSARAQGSRRNFWPYIGWFYQLHTVDGTWTLGKLDNDKLDVKTTPLEHFLKNPEL